MPWSIAVEHGFDVQIADSNTSMYRGNTARRWAVPRNALRRSRLPPVRCSATFLIAIILRPSGLNAPRVRQSHGARPIFFHVRPCGTAGSRRLQTASQSDTGLSGGPVCGCGFACWSSGVYGVCTLLAGHCNHSPPLQKKNTGAHSLSKFHQMIAGHDLHIPQFSRKAYFSRGRVILVTVRAHLPPPAPCCTDPLLCPLPALADGDRRPLRPEASECRCFCRPYDGRCRCAGVPHWRARACVALRHADDRPWGGQTDWAWGAPNPPNRPQGSESAQGPSLPPPEGAPRGRTVLCCEGQAPSPVVHPGHPASPALSLPRVRAPAAPPYPPRVLVAVPMCEGTSSGLRLDAGDAACGGP